MLFRSEKIMVDVFCPKCKKLLFKAEFANIEIKCKCGRVVGIRLYSQKSLLLTGGRKEDIVEIQQNKK